MSGSQLDIFAPRPLAVVHGDALTDDERRVLALLDAHRGHQAAINGELISEAVNMPYDRVRGVIRHLRKHHGLLIGATNCKPQGYFLAVTPEDTDLALRNMITRAMSMLAQAAKIKRISVEAVFGQAAMELEETLNAKTI